MKALSIKTMMLTLASSMLLMFGLSSYQAATVGAAPADEACEALAALGQPCDTDPDNPASQNTLVGVAEDVINILSWIVGIVSVIMIIIGGFRFLTSAGDAGNVQAARNTIVYALVGLAIVAFAQAIVAFVLSRIK